MNYAVGVTVKFIDQVSAGLKAVGLQAAGSAGNLAKVKAQISEIQNAWSAGKTVFNAGMDMAAPIMAAVDAGAKLEKTLKQIQVIMHASNGEMDSMHSTMLKVSDATQYSIGQLGEMSREMAAGGVRSIGDIQALLPQFAAAAEVMQNSNGAAPKSTVHDLTTNAHLFGKYDANAMQPITDLISNASQHTTGGMHALTNSLKYLAPIASRVLHMTDEQVIAFAMTAAQTSGGSGGAMSGRNLSSLLLRNFPGTVGGGGAMTGKGAFGLAVMGGVDKNGFSAVMNKNGGMDIDKINKLISAMEKQADTSEGRRAIAERMKTQSLAHLSKKQAGDVWSQANAVTSGHDMSKEQLLSLVYSAAFGTQGMRVAGVLGEKNTQDQYAHNLKLLQGDFSIQKQQAQLMETYSQQLARIGSNAHNVAQEFGYAILQTSNLVPMMEKFGEALMNLAIWIKENQQIAGLAGKIALLAAAAVSGIGALMMFRAAMMAVSFAFGAGNIATVLTYIGTLLPTISISIYAIGAAFWFLTGLGIAAVVVGMVYAFFNFKAILNSVRTILANNMQTIKRLIGLLNLIPGMGGPLKMIIRLCGQADHALENLGNSIQWLINECGNAMVNMGKLMDIPGGVFHTNFAGDAKNAQNGANLTWNMIKGFGVGNILDNSFTNLVGPGKEASIDKWAAQHKSQAVGQGGKPGQAPTVNINHPTYNGVKDGEHAGKKTSRHIASALKSSFDIGTGGGGGLAGTMGVEVS